MDAGQLARRAVRAVGLAPLARRVRAAGRTGRERAAEWLTPEEPDLVRRDRLDNEHIGLLLSFGLAEDSNCIDVGAHEGELMAQMLRVAPRGRHIAYEPLPHLNAKLRARFAGADVDVDVRSNALSNVREDTEFRFVRNMPGMSGLRERWYPTGEPEIEIIPVHTERMDDDLPDGYAPDLIKIDVEGAEMLVLEGARETLRTHMPIVIFEYGRGTEDTSYGTSPKQIYEFFVDLGYRLFDLDGHGPLSLADFSTSPSWNWVAHR